LCQFLGVPVPDKPFPHINDRKTTKRLYLAARVAAVLAAAGVLSVLIWLTKTLI
jgi:hypothetical protein